MLSVEGRTTITFLTLGRLSTCDCGGSTFASLCGLRKRSRALRKCYQRLRHSGVGGAIKVVLYFILLVISLMKCCLLCLEGQVRGHLDLRRMLRVGRGMFTTSLVQPRRRRGTRTLRERRDALGRVPRHVMSRTFNSMGRLLAVSQVKVTICGRAARLLRCTSDPKRRVPRVIRLYFSSERCVSRRRHRTVPLVMRTKNRRRYINILCLRQERKARRRASYLLFRLITHCMTVIMFGTIIGLTAGCHSVRSTRRRARQTS